MTANRQIATKTHQIITMPLNEILEWPYNDGKGGKNNYKEHTHRTTRKQNKTHKCNK